MSEIDEGQELEPIWRPHRFAVQDALATKVAEMDSTEVPGPEKRFFPEPDGGFTRRVAYSGGPFDAASSHIEIGGWDHTTCDACARRIKPLSPCYITDETYFSELCPRCYATHVVSRLPLKRRVLWRLRRLLQQHTAA